jgi:hypothetical protein
MPDSSFKKPPGNLPVSIYILTDFFEKQKGKGGKKYKNNKLSKTFLYPVF